MNLDAASELYRYISGARLESHLVSHAELKTFSLNLKTFERRLGETKEDDYWQVQLRPLKRYRFRLCAAPLPFDAPDDYRGIFERLQAELIHCDRIYPQHAEEARTLVERAQALTQKPENPMLEAVRDLNLPSEAALLVKESRFVEPLEILLSKHLPLRHLKVVTASQLKGEPHFDALVVIGPMRWFPDYVVTAPRAERLHGVRYGFLGDGWQPQATFLRQKNTPPPRSLISSPTNLQTEEISADELVPVVDWDAVSSRFVRQAQGADNQADNQEVVEARLCVLEGDRAVFLEDAASELVVDPKGDELVRRVKVARLEPGLFLIVRERGRGDYIVPFADQLLGERALEARRAQSHWKGGLRRAVLTKGMTRVLADLKRLGARTASSQNVRNWMSASERKIRPRYFEDFSAVMTYLDLDEAEDYWQKARNINRAHQKAGVRMKQLLLNEVERADLNRLEGRGYQTFAFEAYKTCIDAFRIVEISPQKLHVPLSQVGELLEERDDAWRG